MKKYMYKRHDITDAVKINVGRLEVRMVGTRLIGHGN